MLYTTLEFVPVVVLVLARQVCKGKDTEEENEKEKHNLSLSVNPVPSHQQVRKRVAKKIREKSVMAHREDECLYGSTVQFSGNTVCVPHHLPNQQPVPTPFVPTKRVPPILVHNHHSTFVASDFTRYVFVGCKSCFVGLKGESIRWE
ncbi:hypothetical protein BDY21DRAFT_129007 [Lineolata rhizophorae]|uniref:Secreted protein n=1 Tax=Lineolata rhizophorae TaxID=578093 RepID=A0A6A6NP97_9PEZI|nr:hypothetical protein BDY21DRAFT_129007 [Lineolata rhizophorae]